ncbi:non-structural maintenance of chromosomes element 1 homolog [Cataglyphis hispanica]|uniref:non-structural maintenance of chromosomes element 1 homolog n=1 Tax=Cataglyphis hispanica TaxID=1086592 RepID=UPI00217F3572|nr:non-structural maintenance of chromosomes element 1 homolog [Cataglyphis hispanica]
MVYSKEHKIVLQSIMHEGALLENRVKELISKLFGHENTAQVLNEINAKLQPLYMIVKCINCEVTGHSYWVWASTVQDKTARFHPEFSQAELALLRNVYSEIVTSNNGHVSSTWCLNLCSTLNVKLTKASAEEFLYEMVNKKWLACKSGKYYMGVRSIVELLQYLKDTYQDNLHICTLCKEVLFYGEKCEQCNTTTHIHCLKNYAMTRGGLECPNCHYPISQHDHSSNDNNSAMDIDEIDVETDEVTQPSLRRSKRKHKD